MSESDTFAVMIEPKFLKDLVYKNHKSNDVHKQAIALMMVCGAPLEELIDKSIEFSALTGSEMEDKMIFPRKNGLKAATPRPLLYLRYAEFLMAHIMFKENISKSYKYTLLFKKGFVDKKGQEYQKLLENVQSAIRDLYLNYDSGDEKKNSAFKAFGLSCDLNMITLKYAYYSMLEVESVLGDKVNFAEFIKTMYGKKYYNTHFTDSTEFKFIRIE